MTFQSFYEGRVTWVGEAVPRLHLMADLLVAGSPGAVLDVGCGGGQLLELVAGRAPDARLVGVDAGTQQRLPAGAEYRAADITGGLPARDAEFDAVALGEVIEHVPHPDALLREVRRVLRPGGVLVLSTPNMVCWANRLLVPAGVQPLFTETSSDLALGRRLAVLGQGNEVQGHLKVFSARALQEILEREGYRVTARHGLPFAFPFPLSLVDRLAARRVTWASSLVYVAERLAAEPVRTPPAAPRPITPRPGGLRSLLRRLRTRDRPVPPPGPAAAARPPRRA
jgi:SAM-dependent methyltransferase